MRSFRALVLVAAPMVGSCTPGINEQSSGSGGASSGATHSASSSDSSASVGGQGSVSSATSVSSTTTGAATSSSTGSGPFFAPCAFTDDFAALDMTLWTPTANVTSMNNHIEMQIPAGDEGHLTGKLGLTQPNDCVLTIELTTVMAFSTPITVELAVAQSTNFFSVTYDGVGVVGLKTSDGATASHTVGGKPDAVAIAFHGNEVDVLYFWSGIWTSFGSVPRAAWMDSPSKVIYSFGVRTTPGSVTAYFDDFNLGAVPLSAVGI